MEEEAGQCVLVGNFAQVSTAAALWREWREAGDLRKKQEMTRHEDCCL